MGHCERLSVMDAAFLDAESHGSLLHVGAVAVFDTGPLARPGGGLDIDRLRGYIEAAVARNPRYRQRVVRTPGLGHPVWVDDDGFVLDFHLRHTRLPLPGDDRQLRRLAGRVFSQRLDRDHPLWEMWLVEGLTADRFALIVKIHHCMIDGVAGAGLLGELLRGTADATVPERPQWVPRPAPGRFGLVAADLRARARGLRHLARMTRAARAVPGSMGRRARAVAGGIVDLVRRALPPAPRTPFNPPRIGPHRRFDTARFELAGLKAIKQRLGGTVNDAALAVVAGGLRRAFDRRGLDPDRIGAVRALVPVDVRRADDAGRLGNRVAVMLAPLPVDVADPVVRFETIHRTMIGLKGSGDVEGESALEEIADATGAAVLGAVFRIATRLRVFNLTVTNVPGPPFPLYLLGAPMREVYPLVPLLDTQNVGIALLSYHGGMYVGLAADWHQVPDLHDLVLDLEASYDELARAAGVDVAPAQLSIN